VGKRKVRQKKPIQDPSIKFRYYHMDLTKGDHGEGLLKRIGKRIGKNRKKKRKKEPGWRGGKKSGVRGSQGQSYEE